METVQLHEWEFMVTVQQYEEGFMVQYSYMNGDSW
jgi:hypothetical protein